MPARPVRAISIPAAIAVLFTFAACDSYDGALPAEDGPGLTPDPSPGSGPGTTPTGEPGLQASAVNSTAVALQWTRPPGDDSDAYEVLRDGELVGVSRTGRFLDEAVPPGRHAYAVRGRTLNVLDGIDITTDALQAEVLVPEPTALATLTGGEPLMLDAALETNVQVQLDRADRLAASGTQGDLFVVELLDENGVSAVRRFAPGLEAPQLLPGRDVWYVVADDGLERPVIALDPETLATRWRIDTTTLELTGGCRFARVLNDGALSCRGFADDTLRIGSDAAISPSAPGVRIPTGERLSADDGNWLVDNWTLPADTRPDAFFPAHEWVVRDILSGGTEDRGALTLDDASMRAPFSIDAIGVLGGAVIVAGDLFASGCLRVCVEQLAVPPYVDGHFVARLNRDDGRVDALQRLPLGERLGRGAGEVVDGRLRFTDTDRVSVIDPDSLQLVSVEPVGGQPVGVSASTILTRLPGDPGATPSYVRFVR